MRGPIAEQFTSNAGFVASRPTPNGNFGSQCAIAASAASSSCAKKQSGRSLSILSAGRKVVELDGGQHAENVKDVARDAFLTREGYRVMRFWNHDVLSNTEGVLTLILEAPLQE
jgi:hypothetical protein